MKVSPNGQCLAIAWRALPFHSYESHLCIHDIVTGMQIAAFDLEAMRRKWAGPCFSALIWAPCSSKVLLPETFGSDSWEPPPPPLAIICNICGSNQVLRGGLSSSSVFHWSSNGQYVYMTCRWSQAAQGPAGCVWRAATGQLVLSWKKMELPIWAASSCILFFPQSCTLVGLPVDGSSAGYAGPLHQTYSGPHLAVRNQVYYAYTHVHFAPSGRVLVAAWQLQPFHFLRGTGSINLPQKLGHVDCNFVGAKCNMRLVATSTSGWFTDSLTWHPNPALAHIYAIQSACGRIYLIDTKSNSPIGMGGPSLLPVFWTISQCLYRDGSNWLFWSPDGCQLLSMGHECFSILTFGKGVVD